MHKRPAVRLHNQCAQTLQGGGVRSSRSRESLYPSNFSLFEQAIHPSYTLFSNVSLCTSTPCDTTASSYRNHAIDSTVLTIPEPCIPVKCGSDVHRIEADNMQYVAEHTTVPVQKGFGMHREGGSTYLVLAHVCAISSAHGMTCLSSIRSISFLSSPV